jgi:hypothetical protein
LSGYAGSVAAVVVMMKEGKEPEPDVDIDHFVPPEYCREILGAAAELNLATKLRVVVPRSVLTPLTKGDAGTACRGPVSRSWTNG